MTSGIVRFVAGRLAEAAALLSGPRPPDDEAVHEARRRLKDARGALRLLSPTLGESAVEGADKTLSRAARRLSDARDVRAAADATARLAGAWGRGWTRARRERLVKAVESRLAVRLRPRADGWRRSAAELRSCRARLLAAAPAEPGRRALRAGLRASLRRARRRTRAAELEPGTASLHALRKSVKRLRAQLRLLAPEPRARLRRLLEGLDRLSGLLGDERDLGLAAAALPRRGRLAADARAFAAFAERRQRRLAARALALAGRRLEPSPRRLASLAL